MEYRCLVYQEKVTCPRSRRNETVPLLFKIAMSVCRRRVRAVFRACSQLRPHSPRCARAPPPPPPPPPPRASPPPLARTRCACAHTL
eukprot:1589824-Rhodomonas_salina.1